MISKGMVLSGIRNVLPMIPAVKWPEVYAFLSSLAGREDSQETEEFPHPYMIANTILTLDKPLIFPQRLIDFVVDLFEMDIADENSDAMNDLGACYPFIDDQIKTILAESSRGTKARKD